jgi:cyclopropane fatty-acyl-phospholipid synthase-like methyltransferase
MFNPDEVASYYNTTQNHYSRWWQLGKQLSLHYGIRDKNAKTFSESLINTNRVMMEISGISAADRVLDAGCGVGGAAIYLNRTKGAKVTGISLSEKQIRFATEQAVKNSLSGKVDFHVMDFTKTSFPDETFDVIWACESVCQAPDKKAFISESFRLLKKGGRIIMSDFFLTANDQHDNHSRIRKWCNTWAVSDLVSCDAFTASLTAEGFNSIKTFDYTKNITRSSRRMYLASLVGAIPSELYNLFHPKVSRFAKTHYKCGYFQYMALKEGLWKYMVVLAVK